jgi:hypothetical protein
MLRVLLLLCLLIAPVTTKDSTYEESRTKPGDPATWLEIGRLICAAVLIAIMAIVFIVSFSLCAMSVCSAMPIFVPMLVFAAIPVVIVIAIMDAR